MDVEAEVEDKTRALNQMGVSRETRLKLEAYVDLLDRWRSITNLISRSSWPNLWTRHIADSAQLFRLAPQATRWVDLGSGAGFPGLIIAILLSEKPGGMVHLVESDKRKTAFLTEAARIVSAPVTIHSSRIDAAYSAIAANPEIVTARALAPLAELVEMAAPFLRRGAIGLFIKGQNVHSELTDAALSDSFSFDLIESATMPSGRIVRVVCK